MRFYVRRDIMIMLSSRTWKLHEMHWMVLFDLPESVVEILGTTYLSFSLGNWYTLIFLSSVAGVAMRIGSFLTIVP